VAPIATSHAQEHAGNWDCFVADPPTDVDAHAFGGATTIGDGLNRYGAEAARGTVVTMPSKNSYAGTIVCVKH
jgi:hypothetical protein